MPLKIDSVAEKSRVIPQKPRPVQIYIFISVRGNNGSMSESLKTPGLNSFPATFKGVFTPIVCFSPDEPEDLTGFHTGNMSREPESIDNEPCESCCLFICHGSREFWWAEKGESVFLWEYVTLSKTDRQNLHLIIITAIIWATFQAKIIERNSTF